MLYSIHLNTTQVRVFNRKGGTNTAAALRLLVSSYQEGKIKLRDGHTHVAIVVTDGKCSYH